MNKISARYHIVDPESDHETTESAAERVHYLNGGKDG